MQVHSVGGAFGALALGLLFVCGAVLYVWGVYRIVKRVWWREHAKYLARRAVG